MKKSIALIILLSIIISCKPSNEEYTYPIIDSKPITETYFDVNITDPYRNLEDLEDSTVVNWIRNQSDYANNVLDNIPGRQKLIDKQTSYNNSNKYSFGLVTYSIDGNFFYTKANRGEKITSIYYKANLDAEEELLYNIEDYSSEEDYNISYLRPDWNGGRLAIGLSKKGEEFSEIIVVEISTKKILPGVVTYCMTNFSGINWLSDNSGFIYTYSPNNKPTESTYWTDMQSIVYKLGEDPNNRVDVFSKFYDSRLGIKTEDFPLVYNYDTVDGLVFGVIGGSSAYYDIFYKKEDDLLDQNIPWKPFAKESDKIERFRINSKGEIIFLSANNSPNNRIGLTSISNINFDDSKTLVKEKKGIRIGQFQNTKHGIYFTTQKNGVEEKLYKLNGDKEIEIEMPTEVAEMNIQLKSIDQNFMKISTWGSVSSGQHYIFDLENETFKFENIVPHTEYPDLSDLVVKHTEISSHDGAMVPVTIIHKKGLEKNGNTPSLFYGYGAYGGSGGVSFNPNFLTWAAEGGILVYAYVRGGGQKGEDWHRDGYKKTKPNTWKDMIATTEYMIAEGYTNSEKTALWGSSAGGILAGRAMTDRPDLYQAVILTSPALNMVRSEIQPNGKNSIKEFGTVEIKEEFEALLEMDSYHHIKEGVDYPATLVTGGMKDGRVVIWDPAKFVARLQASSTNNPVLFDVKFDEGHSGMDSDMEEIRKIYANVFSFALWNMGYQEYQPVEK